MILRGMFAGEAGTARRTWRGPFNLPRLYRSNVGDIPGGGGGGTRFTNAARIQRAIRNLRFWYDNIPASLKDLQRMIKQDLISGVTTNPAILANAIKSGIYDKLILRLAAQGKKAEEIAYAVNARGIKALAKTLLPVYEKAKGKTGFASIEVDPRLANETDPQVKQGLELFKLINLPNIMIKIPATEAGVKAIQELTGQAVNVNATLIFSEAHYLDVVEAYLNGLAIAHIDKKPLERIHSVASFFVSRFDTDIDKRLADNAGLQGKAAVAMAKRINQLYRQIFFGEAGGNNRVAALRRNWKALKQKGANVQTLLLASTSVKNPSYAKTKYVLDILGPDTINTLPPATLDELRGVNGEVPVTLTVGVDEAVGHLQTLMGLGIDINKVGQELQDQGLGLFVKPYLELLAAIEAKIK